MDCSKHTRQQWVSKFTSGWCATGKMMWHWGNRLTASCQLFNAEVENTYHIMARQAVGALNAWETSAVKLEEWLDCHETCPDLNKLVMNIVMNWKLGRPIDIHNDIYCDGVRRVMQSQKEVGWRLFLD